MGAGREPSGRRLPLPSSATRSFLGHLPETVDKIIDDLLPYLWRALVGPIAPGQRVGIAPDVEVVSFSFAHQGVANTVVPRKGNRRRPVSSKTCSGWSKGGKVSRTEPQLSSATCLAASSRRAAAASRNRTVRMFTGWAGEPLIPVQDSPSTGGSLREQGKRRASGRVGPHRTLGRQVGCGGQLRQPGALRRSERLQCCCEPLRPDELDSVMPGACGPPSGPDLSACHNDRQPDGVPDPAPGRAMSYVVLPDHVARVGGAG